MAETLDTLKKFRDINASFPYTEPIRQWKEKGGKVVAWGCNYVPEEIIYAADILPVRLTADGEELPLDEANAYMTIYACSYPRSCLDMIIKDQYSFLDGFVTCSSCDGMRYLFEHIEAYHPFPFLQQFDTPGKSTPRTLKFYQKEITGFKQKLEEHFKVKISDDKLRSAIEVYNRMRALGKRLYELRKVDTPPISGAEILEVMNAAIRMPKEDFNRLAEELLSEIDSKKRELKGRARIMVIGTICQSTEFVRGIEALGGLVVTDALCNGVRYISDMVDTNGASPMETLSKRYLNQFSCPRMAPWEDRIENIVNLAKEYRVEGVVFQAIRYCIPHTYDMTLVRSALEEAGIPMLFLNVEYGMPATGQIRTRVQAFLEMIEKEE